MKKLSLLISLFMMVLLAACGGNVTKTGDADGGKESVAGQEEKIEFSNPEEAVQYFMRNVLIGDAETALEVCVYSKEKEEILGDVKAFVAGIRNMEEYGAIKSEITDSLVNEDKAEYEVTVTAGEEEEILSIIVYRTEAGWKISIE